ncbi:MAG: ribonuclease Z [Lachnospiraceae bacterium]|nr:ribonuclease Z [Lachnospiraceae bacterium]
MLDVCLLGTGGMMPLPRRRLTSFMTRYDGSSLLIDCGEGTQIGIKDKGWSFKPIDYLCITHFHADHISGLPGLLLAMGNAERTEPLTIIGPRGVEAVVKCLRVIAPELPFDVNFIELTEKTHVINAFPYEITAFRVNHRITCYGYTINIHRAGKFDVERAQSLGLPVRLWNPLQKGETVEFEGEYYTPEMVMGPPRRGIKVTYTTDTRPTQSIIEAAADADLFVCEGMYGEAGTREKAKEHMHMNFEEAAEIAAEARPHRMWLTHFSPSMVRPAEYADVARAIFPETYVGKDGMSDEISFADE